MHHPAAAPRRQARPARSGSSTKTELPGPCICVRQDHGNRCRFSVTKSGKARRWRSASPPPAARRGGLESGWEVNERSCRRSDRTLEAVPRGQRDLSAIDDVSVSVARGEFVAIVGRSGSGKSTLMSLLGLLERPDAGRYLLNGREVGGMSEDARAALRSRKIGFVFQLPALLSRASALENVECPLGYCNVGGREAQRRANLALTAWVSGIAPTTGRISCPAVNNSGSPSLGPLSMRLILFSLTSRPAPSIAAPATKFSACSGNCTGMAGPSSWLRILRRSPTVRSAA